MTPLDRAHASMIGDEDEIGRRIVYAALAASELFVALESEASDDRIEPLILQTGDGQFALAFDTEARLGDFLPSGAAYAALPGREVIAMLGAAGLGLAMNPDVAPSAMLLPADVLGWITGQGSSGVARVVEVEDVTGGDLPEALQRAVEARAPMLAEITGEAILVESKLVDGSIVPVLMLVDVPEAVRPICLAALSELAGLLGIDDDLPVAFIEEAPGGALLDAARRTGFVQRAEIEPETGPVAPGSDPSRPPRLI